MAVPDLDSSRKGDKMNGTIHGEPDASSRSRSSKSKSKSKSKRRTKRTFSAWLISQLLRLAAWYTIVTFLFRCPPTSRHLKDTSPHICTPYLQFREWATPYARPYYDQYAAPYVQQVQPYIDQANNKLYQPAYAAYTQYGAPRVAQAQHITQQQWDKTIRPQLDVLQKQTAQQYQTLLAPHVKKAHGAIKPYYEPLVTSASDIWELELRPVYQKTRPYADKLYQQGSDFAVNTALPQAQFFGSIVRSFWSRQIWPRIRILYGENVEPQLLRITERLGRYKDGKKLEAEIKSMESSSKLSDASSRASSSASSLASTLKEATASPSSAANAAASSASSASSSTLDSKPDPKVQFHKDLKSWEHISTIAVQEGADDLQERIKDITDRQISSAESLGDALVVQLEQTVEAAINSVKSNTLQVIARVPEDAEPEQVQEAKDDLTQGIRAAGQNIKQRAQAVREWKRSHQAQTTKLVEKALQSTLETIDSIREIRLSEIGRKYASSSLPHKEWSKYNDLKKATQDWRNDVKNGAHAHEGITADKNASDDIEHRAMAIAEDAAKELARLREVGKWKIDAVDDSDDFSTKYVPAPVRKAKEQIVEKVAQASQAALGEAPEQQSIVESATSVIAEQASKLTSSASEQVVGSSTGPVESATSKVAEKASSLSDEILGSSTGSFESAVSRASEKVIGTEQPIVGSVSSQVMESASSLSEQAIGSSTGSVESAASKASKKIVGTESTLSDSVTSAASSLSSRVADKPNTQIPGSKLSSILSAQKEKAKSIASEASSSGSSIVDSATSAPSVVAQASSSASSLASAGSSSASSLGSAASSSLASASSSIASAAPAAEAIVNSADSIASQASEAPKKVWGGAMAQQIVEVREPIMDDDIVDADGSYSSSIQSMASVAGEQINSLTQIVQDAFSSGLSSATNSQGSAESVTSLASAQFSSALSAASSAISGAEPNALQSGSSLANEQYQSAYTAASYAIYGTPVAANPYAAVGSLYQSAMLQASSQYNNAVASASSLWLDGQNAAQSGSAVAQEKYDSAVREASYAIYGTPVTAAPLAHASSAYNSAIEEASRHYDAVKSRVSEQISGPIKPVHEQMFLSAESAYSNAVAVASSKLHQAGIMTSQNAYDSISSVASARLADAVSAASAQYASAKSLVGAEPTPVHQQYLASAQKAYYEALGVAHGRYSEFVEAASSLVAPTPTATGVSGHIESALSEARGAYSGYVSEARSRYTVLTNLASSQAKSQGLTSIDDSVMDNLNAQLADAMSVASSKFGRASADVSSAVLGQTATGVESVMSEASQTAESVASRASENWDALISKASQQVYGAPQPFTASVASAANQYAAQVTDVAAAQWSAVQDVFKDLVVDKEPDFIASVYSRLQSAYSTGAPALASQASSYASGAYSAVSAAFIPPTQVPGILEQMQSQLNAAVDAASTNVYGSSKGTIEQATEAAASMYTDAASQVGDAVSQVSEAVYGKESNYVQAAQASFSDIGASASSAIYAAIYGTPTAFAAGSSASSIAASVYSSISSQGEQAASAASASASKAVFGEEQTYLEGIQSQLSAAVASANSRLNEMGVQASSYAGKAASQISSAAGAVASQVNSAAGDAASSVSSVVSQVTGRVRDEL